MINVLKNKSLIKDSQELSAFYFLHLINLKNVLRSSPARSTCGWAGSTGAWPPWTWRTPLGKRTRNLFSNLSSEIRIRMAALLRSVWHIWNSWKRARNYKAKTRLIKPKIAKKNFENNRISYLNLANYYKKFFEYTTHYPWSKNAFYLIFIIYFNNTFSLIILPKFLVGRPRLTLAPHPSRCPSLIFPH